MSDALRSNVFVRYSPEVIACACIFLSARMLKIPLPNNPPWFLAFDATEAQIVDICENILALYDRPKVRGVQHAAATYLQFSLANGQCRLTFNDFDVIFYYHS